MAASPALSASSHALGLLQSLHSQLRNHDFCDIVIAVGTREFTAHKVVLAAASPYFHAMFTVGLVESSQEKVQVHGTSSGIFELLLNFIYTGDVHITEKNCQDLLCASDLFGISNIVRECCHFLQQNIEPSNCLGIYNLADTHNCNDLKSYAEEYVCRHFLYVCENEEFLVLDKDVLIKVLSNEHLGIEREMQVFDAALRWISHDVSLRKSLIFQVLDVVRIPLIAKQLLDMKISECRDLSLMVPIKIFAKDFHESLINQTSKIDVTRRCKPYLFREREGTRRSILIVGGCHQSEDCREGQTLSSAELYDTFHKTWKQVPAVTYGRSAHGTAVLNGLVYVFGGEHTSMIYDNMECYDPVSRKWTAAPSLSIPRCDLGAAVVDGYIYAFGGWVGSEIGDTIERFSPLNNQWEQVGKMQTTRTSMGVVAYEGLIYVLGGLGDSNDELSCVESYDPVTRRWCKLADMLTPRAFVAACAGEDSIYAIGGAYSSDMATYRETLSSVEKYDIHMDKWTFLTDMQTSRAGAAVVYHNNMLYVFGGRTITGHFGHAFQTMDTVECYDLQTKSWSTLDSLHTGRHDAGIAVI